MNELMRLDDFNVPGFGLTVTGDLEIRTQDLSGETSGTARAEQGLKPKKLNVFLSIRFKDKTQLHSLFQVIEARDENGEGKVYTIANRDANAVGIRQVKFTDRVSWKPQEGKRAWDVSFVLREYFSVPEKAEQRESQPETVAQKSEGKAVEQEKAPVPEEPAADPAAPEEPSGIEQTLEILNNWLAPDEDS